VTAKQLADTSNVQITYRLKSAAVPVNLINEVASVGFDYGMSAKEVADNLVDGHQIIWEKQKSISLK
jgi:hypothetical protein